MEDINNIKPYYKYPSEIRNLISDLKYKNFPVIVIGSASRSALKYYGDIDLDTFIYEQNFNDVNDEIKHIMNNIEKKIDTYFFEFKIQMKNENKIKYSSFEDFKKSFSKDLKKNFKKIIYLKIDLIILCEKKFTECSINYWFQKKNQDDELEDDDIYEAIKEYEKEGNYFKALKRKYLIYLINENKEKVLELEKIFNSNLGEKYMIKSNLEAIKKLLEKYDDELITKQIIYNLNEIGVKPNINKIDETIKKIEDQINRKAKIINKKFILP